MFSKGLFLRVVETMDSSERGMNPVAKTIIQPWKEYWPSRGSNQRISVLMSTGLPTELWGSAQTIEKERILLLDDRPLRIEKKQRNN